MKLLIVALMALTATSCAVRLTDKHLLGCATETSGLAVSDDSNKLYTIEDSGNGPNSYTISKTGEILGCSVFPHHKNIDWEAMANDSDSYYIGDIGNNLRNRDTLTIYKKSFSCPFDDILETQFICDHPLSPFDFEAMFYVNDSMYLITKNHKEKYTYLFRVYIDYECHHITPIDSARIRGQITGADYDEKTKLLVLTGYRWYIPFVMVHKNTSAANALQKPFKRRTFWLRPALQTEAIVIVNPGEIYISAEGNPLHKPALFRLKIHRRVSYNKRHSTVGIPIAIETAL